MKQQMITILGSTGSIGVSTLDVMARHPDRFQVFALVAHSNVDVLFNQALHFQPEHVVICDANALQAWHQSQFSQSYHQQTGKIIHVNGSEALEAVCTDSKVTGVMAAIVGAAGMQPVLHSLQAGKRVFLANKESLVLGGRFMLQACQESGAQLLPVDSEHNAIYQCLPAQYDSASPTMHGIERLILTASGGPFRTLPLSDFAHITPEQAIAHPNWSMGKKISVDSATMANKSLELIEALWLFGLPSSQLDVLIHPQSIVHSMVEYRDGSVLAQLGCPDMRTPIAHVLGLPERLESGSPRLNLAKISSLTFEDPDFQRFPMLNVARHVLNKPDVLGPVFNAANEVAVCEFLKKQLSYPAIHDLVAACLEVFEHRVVSCLEDTFELDQAVRVHAQQLVRSYSR